MLAHKLDLHSTQQAYSLLVRDLQERLRRIQQTESISRKVEEILGPSDGSPLTPQILARLAREVAEEFVISVCRIDTSRDIDVDGILDD